VYGLLPSLFLKSIGVCLLIFGLYDTRVYWYSLRHGHGTFDFFGKTIPASHILIKLGFGGVLTFYYVVGSILIIFG